MTDYELIVADGVPESLVRVPGARPDGPVLRIGVVQHAWQPDIDALERELHEAIGLAADQGARIVFLPEITLLRYPADGKPEPGTRADASAEELQGGRTHRIAARAAAEFGIHVHASLYERSGAADGRGYNTAIVVAPSGGIVARTRKTHIPVTAGYYEDHWFEAGPAEDAYPVHAIDELGLRLGLPTCWDEWFPEVARAYGLGGANVLAYPTAIGSEPDHPGVDTEPLWRQVIVAHGIENGLFMVVPNRTGREVRPDGTPGNAFYGSSFVSDPYGRILVRAPRDRKAVLVADLDLAQGQDWIDLFPFFRTRRPDTYGILT
ncbi:MAG: hydrolase [Microbacteriaceae bacterium]|nr:hydrolase [Microbacteriaceae bacterium]